MGVHGLWKLIEPSGQMVPLESLAGKVLAVDISIWLHQAVKGMHDAHGAPVAVAHLLILFHRLCKLLFYKIKPVFVFDGGVPLLKSQTMAARRQRSSAAKSEALKVREKLIKNLLKHEAVRQVLSNETASAVLGLNSFTLPGPSVEEDLYKLPPIAAADYVDSEYSDAATSSDEDSDKPSEDIHSIDVTSQNFLNLPAEVRHDILTELIETRKQSSWKSLDSMPKQSDSFSDFQMNRLLKRHAVQTSLEKAGKEMGGRALSLKELESLLGDQGVLDPKMDLPSRRIAQDSTTRYMLVQKDSAVAPGEFDIMKHLEEVEWSSESDTDVILEQKRQKREPKSEKDAPRSVPKPTKVRMTDEVAEILSVLEDGDTTADVKIKVENLRTKINHDKTETEKSGAGDSESITKTTENSDSVAKKLPQPGSTEVPAVATDKKVETVSEGTADSCIVGSNKTGAAENTHEGSKTTESVDSTRKNSFPVIPEDIDKVQTISNGMAEPATADSRIADQSNNRKDESETGVGGSSQGGPKTTESVDCLRKNLHPLIHQPASIEVPAVVTQSDKVQTVSDNTAKPKIANSCTADQSDNSKTESEEGPKTTESVDCIRKNSFPLIPEVVSIEPDKQVPCLDLFVGDSTAEPEIANSSSDSESDFIPITHEEMETLSLQSETTARQLASPTGQADSLTVVINPTELSQKDDLFADVFDPQAGEPPNKDGADAAKEQISAEDFVGLEEEQLRLMREKGMQERHSMNLTDQIYTDAQELLRLFGIPFVVAPMEAEAQCATLNALGLTEGTITDDSDIWLFGGLVVYKNFFNQNKHVLEYRSENIEKSFKLTREELIKMALLVGSDYTAGLTGIGPVTALEIIAAFQTPPGRGPLEGLHKFRQWFTGAAKSGPPRATLRKKIKNAVMTPGFPSRAVVEAYLNPQVDDSKEPFSWAKPNLDLIRKYTKAKMGWSSEKCDDVLLPVLKKLEEKNNQTTIDKHFRFARKSTTADGMLSKRVETAIKRLGNSSVESDEPIEEPKPRKRRKANGARPAGEAPKEDNSKEAGSSANDVEAKLRLIKAKLHRNMKVPQREMAQKLQEEKKKEAVKIFRTYGKIGKKRKKVFAKEEANLSESSSSDND